MIECTITYSFIQFNYYLLCTHLFNHSVQLIYQAPSNVQGSCQAWKVDGTGFNMNLNNYIGRDRDDVTLNYSECASWTELVLNLVITGLGQEKDRN